MKPFRNLMIVLLLLYSFSLSMAASGTQESTTAPSKKENSSLVKKTQRLKDPTKPNKTDSVKTQALVLNGIIHKKNHRYAIINQALYHIGDHLSAGKIIRITTHSVVISDQDQLITLELFHPKHKVELSTPNTPPNEVTK